MEKIVYIYKITNEINGKIYIGQSIQPNIRWAKHRSSAMKNPTQTIHYAMRKYGIENFIFEIIATCFSLDAANDAETMIVAQENSLVPNGYNVSNGGSNAPKTEKWKEMMSEATTARISNNPELLQKMMEGKRKFHEKIKLSGKSNPCGFQRGRTVSIDTRNKISVANSGRIQSKEELSNRSKSLQEYYKNHASKNLGKPKSEQLKNVLRGKKYTAVTLTQIQKMEICDKFQLGYSQNKLAKEYGISRCTIKKILGV